MEEEKSIVSPKPVIDDTPLREQTADVANKIIAETDAEAVKDLTHLFNVIQAKKNVLRVMKLDSLFDHVSDAMMDRFTKRPDEFSNDDLVAYMKTVQTAIEKSSQRVNMVDETPAIVVNNTQVNVGDGSEGLSRESRARVADVIQKILASANQPVDAEFEDKTEQNTDENGDEE